MKLEIRNCGIAAILAVVLFSISVGYILNSGQASYTPANPVIASWDVTSNLTPFQKVNGTLWYLNVDKEWIGGAVLMQSGATGTRDDSLRWMVSFPDTAPHTLYIRALPGSNRGIITVGIDGINQSTVNLYSTSGGTTVYTTTITPSRVGNNYLQFWMASKDASSTGWLLPLIDWWII